MLGVVVRKQENNVYSTESFNLKTALDQYKVQRTLTMVQIESS